MTEREIEARLRNERISLPDGFEARQEAALCRVMAKRECVLPKRMAWLVAALALMMSAAAIAAGGRGLAFFWRQASPEAKRVLFAALCRALGVPARLAPEDGAAEYWHNGVWKRTEGRDTRGTVVLICPTGEKWVCGVDFSLSALTPDGAPALAFGGRPDILRCAGRILPAHDEPSAERRPARAAAAFFPCGGRTAHDPSGASPCSPF